MDIIDLARQIRSGDRRALAKGITLVESTRVDHRSQATELLETLMPDTGHSIRLGISGVPGVGKSTFIETFGNHVIAQGHKVAVLAVDPTSALSGGSILGDKTRMELLSRNPDAFIRPSPAGKTLGGVTRRTRETLLLCEAAGFDVVIVETVGVGQSETAVAEMTDMFLLLLLPGGGDELQGIKRGIMELADLILVNKSDGDQQAAANRTVSDYAMALHFLHPRSKNWKARVLACSALREEGIGEIWDTVEEYRQALSAAGEIDSRRAAQSRAWMWSETADCLLTDLKEHRQVKALVAQLEADVTAGRLPPTVAAQKLINAFKQSD
ncbi:MAG: methylmalonyl Co-A mutase-associated GTPase MeaB [Pseudomonadales bacterium]|nr:methylmalonyl Co-A mutase-associated GTPase MeaB [Pseudomonadales bacterium]MCP5170937.1 methylmalonyl Co-A mutase-associated GTPase MeaB [Pseudomonadales bacterium]MCP5301823.1 methylmalonyl Co-A mutase-associated GTPase MeaB [Pseudomonadales bacterium]